MKLDKAYEPQQHETAIYKLWEDSGAFKPNPDPAAKPFCIIMPPPNANGDLHLGHGQYVVEDLMSRFRRMQGYSTLWLPGTDHAGIETQFVFERDVLAPQGKTRFDLGPQQFYQAVMEYTQANQAKIINQLRSLGFSADWSRLKFTLDNDIVELVYDTFEQLHQDGLIYRGNRIVNYCTRCNAGFADVEIKHIDRDDAIYTLDYGSLQVATTRPETIFADSGVAVNPNDQRYQQLVGQAASLPLVDRPLPIVADPHVDPAFGTGALKVTPGHDPNDYEIGLRHNLPQITVIDFDGRMINVPEELAGLTVEEARRKTVAMLTSAGKLVATQPLRHAVGIHDRCGTVIEPLITEQWFIKVTSLAQKAAAAVSNGDTRITPKRFEKVYLDWIANLHDWNISRQIWWGIRIPVYYKTSNDPAKDPYIIARTETEAKAYYGAGNYRAETDTFDTWFSSSQWPVVTLQTTDDFKRFYPTDFMGTARDILTKWIVTMMMMGLYRTGQAPFRSVYLWGMVNDQHGKKMSKSKGNVINPLDMTAKYGTDALRLALTIGITPGNDGSLSEQKIEGYRNFCNKLWNVARYVLAAAGEHYSPTAPQPRNLADRWILDRVSSETSSITASIENYQFSDAGTTAYALLWDDFADWYIEASKSDLNVPVLVHCLEVILKLVHPFAPFVTEAIWQNMSWQQQQLIVSPWPSQRYNFKDSGTFDDLRSAVNRVRHLKSEAGVTGMVDLAGQAPFLAEPASQQIFERLSGTRLVGPSAKQLPHCLRIGSLDLYLGLSDQQQKEVITVLQKRLTNQQNYLNNLERQLADQRFISSAPEAVVSSTRSRHKAAAEEVSLTKDLLNSLS